MQLNWRMSQARNPLRITAWALLAVLATTGLLWPAFAKTPGETYCFYGKCHRVKTLSEMQELVGTQSIMAASHYESCLRDRYNPCGLTSSGEPFAPDRPDNAASPIYPDGTIVLVWSPVTGEAAVLRINNAGPYWDDRTLDVSIATAKLLGFHNQGVASLAVRVLSAPTEEEAAYKRKRTYDRVLGHIGKFESPKAAMAMVATLTAAEALASSVFAPAAGHAVITARRAVSADIAVAEANPASETKGPPATQVAARDRGPFESSTQRRPRRAFRDGVETIRADATADSVVTAMLASPVPESARMPSRLTKRRIEPLSRSAASPLATASSIPSRRSLSPATRPRSEPRKTNIAAVQGERPPKKAAPSLERAAKAANVSAAVKPVRKSSIDHMVQGFRPHAPGLGNANAAAPRTPVVAPTGKGSTPQGPVSIVKKQASSANKSAALRPGLPRRSA